MTMPGDLPSMLDQTPPSAAQDLRYRQGVILTFDPVTLSNTVAVGGAVMTDLPLLGVGEATLLVPGAVVGLITIGNLGGGQGLAILGRLVSPNTAAAADAVSLLSARTQVGYDTTAVSTTSATYVDLGGPSASGVVGPSGRVLVFLGALISGLGQSDGAGAMRDTARVSLELSGANVLAASDEWAYSKAFSYLLAEVSVANVIGRDVAAHLFEGLTPGMTTFTAVYNGFASGALTSDFADRIVIAMFL
jgi:hypothetical protein